MCRILLALLIAFGAFVPCAPSASAQDVRDLLGQIRQHEDRVGSDVFDQLGGIGTPEAFEALTKAFSVLRGPAGWSPAYRAFRFFKGQESQADAIEFLLDAVLDEKGDRSKYALIGLLTFELEAKSAFLEILRDCRTASLRARALKPLMEEFKERQTSAALTMFLKNFRPGLTCAREAGVGFLTSYDPELSAPIFQEFLKGKRTHLLVKVLILDALTDNLDKRWEATLLQAASAKEEVVQLAALRGLEALKSDGHEEFLAKMCKSKLSELRFEAYLARARILGHDEGWLNEIRKLSVSKDAVQRQISAALSGTLPRAEAMEKLTVLLRDSNLAVKSEALMAFSQLRRKDSIPILIGRMDVESGTMKWRLQKTLEMLTAKPFGPQMSAWKRWWADEGEEFSLPSREEAKSILHERDVWGESGDTSAFYGLPIVSDRVIFILDTSGSMKNEHISSSSGDPFDTGVDEGSMRKTTRLDVAQEQLRHSLVRMKDKVKFNIIFFDSKVRAMSNELVKMSAKKRIESIQYLKDQTPKGATAIFDALESAFKDPDVDTIYLLSDGQPTGGSLNDSHLIREKVKKWNRTRHINIHCVSVGGNVSLLVWLAQDSGGEYIRVD